VSPKVLAHPHLSQALLSGEAGAATAATPTAAPTTSTPTPDASAAPPAGSQSGAQPAGQATSLIKSLLATKVGEAGPTSQPCSMASGGMATGSLTSVSTTQTAQCADQVSCQQHGIIYFHLGVRPFWGRLTSFRPVKPRLFNFLVGLIKSNSIVT